MKVEIVVDGAVVGTVDMRVTEAGEDLAESDAALRAAAALDAAITYQVPGVRSPITRDDIAEWWA